MLSPSLSVQVSANESLRRPKRDEIVVARVVQVPAVGECKILRIVGGAREGLRVILSDSWSILEEMEETKERASAASRGEAVPIGANKQFIYLFSPLDPTRFT